jgi:ApbE superfamily uncharacterized protein (UPF0280 family)
MSILRKKAPEHVDVPIQDLLLRISGPYELYEEARAVGMLFWEQVQSYAIRTPEFRNSKRPVEVPSDAPAVVRDMATLSASAGVGPMLTFRGALTEFVGRRMAELMPEVTVSCGEDHYVVAHKRVRLGVGADGRHAGLGVIVKPELGPHGIHMDLKAGPRPGEMGDGLVILASSCILAAGAAAAARAILAKQNGLRSALAYLKGLPGLHGAIIIREDRIGVAGGLELAA